MITKHQWNLFCQDLRLVRSWGLDCFIQTHRVLEVTGNDIIKTYQAGCNPIIYKFGESVDEHKRLKDLYESVRISGTKLTHFRPVFKALVNRNIFEICP